MSKSKAQIEFEKKWGTVCKVCKLRTKTIFASAGAEGGRNSICRCKKEK